MSQPPRKLIHLPKVRMLNRGGRSTSGLRITNVKSIRPPDPEVIKKQEEDKLRAQLQKEIVSRSKTCAYKGYDCLLPVLAQRQYCGRHILQDPTAPYRQCAHKYRAGDQCTKPAPKDVRDPRDPGLCYDHARAALYARQRSAAPPPPVTTSETLLNQLQHYVRPERLRTTSCASSVSVVSDPADQDQVSPLAVDPFKQIEASAVNTAYSAAIMECASGSESECESVTLGPGGTCRAPVREDLSDYEHAPCEEQPMWKAGVYTVEEAVSEAKFVLKSLQSAYIRQMDRLRILLQMARLQYIKTLKAEREQYCSIHTQAVGGGLSARERRQLRKLKAYAAYHRPHRQNAVLARKLYHKRMKMHEQNSRPAMPGGRCSFSEGGVRCAAASLPAARHCLNHVLHDNHQVLFHACGESRGGTTCHEVVARLPLPSAACRYHTTPPPYTVFTLKKDESESDASSHSTSDESQLDQPEQPDQPDQHDQPDQPDQFDQPEDISEVNHLPPLDMMPFE